MEESVLIEIQRCPRNKSRRRKKTFATFFATNFFAVLLILSSQAYMVKPGDTLSQLSLQLKTGRVYGKKGRLERLIAHNPHILNPDKIQAGRTIVSFPDSPDTDDELTEKETTSDDVKPTRSPEVLNAQASVSETPAAGEDHPSKTPSSLVFDLGAGISYLAYREKINSTDFNLNEAGITLKGGANYRLNTRWELGGSAFITAIPLKLSSHPDALSTARFYGINARASYELCDWGEQGKLYLSGGWYLWGMAMPAAPPLLTYGVSYLGGPQILLSARFKTESGRAYSVYGKFAAMIDHATVSLANRELALGGSYQISSISKDFELRRLWLIGIDLANMNFSRTDQAFQLNSLSLSISTRF